MPGGGGGIWVILHINGLQTGYQVIRLLDWVIILGGKSLPTK